MWKRFQFFERQLVQEGDSGNPNNFIQELNITCCASGRSKLVIGDAEGCVHLLDRSFQPLSWQAFDHRVTLVHQMKYRNILVAIGNDKMDMEDTSIKIYNLDKKEGDEPLLVRILKIEKSSRIERMVPVTCVAVQEDMSQMAVGLCNGAVIQIFGDLIRDKNPKQRVLLEPDTGVMVTGLGFPSPKSSSSSSSVAASSSSLSSFTDVFNLPLFCVTSTSCYAFVAADKDREREKRINIEQSRGADLNCVTFSDEMEVILADEEGVFFYSLDGPGACYGFEGMHAGTGRKKYLLWFRSYLVVVSASDGPQPFDSLQIYDLSNRYIAFSSNFERITHIIAEFGYLYILTADRRMYRLSEKDIQTKMETLFKKNHYETAIKLALRSNYDVIDIYREYGNHLYDKKDYSGAMDQYLKTIGSGNSISRLEPSYVIRKFLDAQRIGNLTSYLQKLHEEKMANSDHTTLLLNCYTKLNDVNRLDSFVRDENLSFEKETAIRVCRQAGFHDHALYLARKHNEHNWYLRIMLEDLQKYTEALVYMYTLDFFECEKNVKKYGKALLSELPSQTTQLLMELCTQYKQRAGPGKSASMSSAAVLAAVGNPSPSLSHSSTTSSSSSPFSSSGGRMNSSAGSSLTSSSPSQPLSSTLSSLLDRVGGDKNEQQHHQNQPPPEVEVEELCFDEHEEEESFSSANIQSRPEDFIHIFVDEPDWLIVFLEFMIEVGKATEVVADTLFELYLSASSKTITSPSPLRSFPSSSLSSLSPSSPSSSPSSSLSSSLAAPEDPRISRALERACSCDFHSIEESERRKEKALALLKNSAVKCDCDHLLMLCKTHNFREGLLFLYEKMKLYTEIVQFHQSNRDFSSIVKACMRYGETEPQLWRSALTYFVEQDPSQCRAELIEVLANIDKKNLMPPLMVIDTLAKQPKITLELVQDYVNRKIHQQNKWIEDDERQIRQYTLETETMRQEIHDLKTSAKVFNLHKCTMCSVQLDLPTVHFMCMHSFHHRCLNDNERECPKCAPSNRKVLEIKKSLDDQVAQHDNFAKQLEVVPDGFSTVAEYFGRGLFRPTNSRPSKR